MRPLTYLITICLLIISSQVYSQNLCEPGFLSSEVTNSSCNLNDGAIDLTLTGGVVPFSFEWTGPFGFAATTEDISNLPAGNYFVRIIDAAGEECFKDFDITTITNGIQCTHSIRGTGCEGGGAISLECTGGTEPYTYLWSDGNSTQNISDLSPGTYYVTITDADGCTISLAYDVDGSGIFCDTLYIDPIQVSVGNQIQVDFVVTDFTNILSMQYTMHYDPAVLQFSSIGNFSTDMNMNMNLSHFNPNNPGYITLSWISLPLNPLSLPDGRVIYSIFFTPLTSDNSEVYIDGNPVVEEITSGEFGVNQIYLSTSSANILVDGNTLSGYIYKDENGNCENDSETGLRNWPVNITDGTDEWNVVTDMTGHYSVVVPDGTYDISVTPVNEHWDLCNNNVTLDVVEFVAQDFGAVALTDCPVMEVDVAIPNLRRCFPNQIYISYCNYGTVTANNSYIELELDPDMVFLDATVTPTSVNGNLLTFDIGDIGIGACGAFSLTVLLDENCDTTLLGQTHCTTATIFPNAPCSVNALWEGASIELRGNCDGSNVNFEIENVGTEIMTEPSSFIVIEDHVMGMSVPEDFILSPGEKITISKPANGSTYYMSVDQVAYHPGASHPSLAVEGCGTNSNGEVSLGFVAQYGQDDQNSFVDIECVENVGSYDPNDKAAMLKGFGEEHFIYANEPMEYLVRFQNTGTDTAFNIVVKDELSPNFDITSLRVGASSHDYTFSIEGRRTMVFTFENIHLPDSTADLAGSNGFLSYKVNQLLDNPDGTVLENTADIYFDFNEAIVTNTTKHIIGSEFIISSTFFNEKLGVENAISVYPNPSDDIMTFELEEWNTDLQLEIFDLTGKQIMTKTFDNKKIILPKEALKEGMYFYSITSQRNLLTSGKFIFL